MEMDFGTPAVGILSVVPVNDENPHYSTPARRA
jgi:hypothetical protein